MDSIFNLSPCGASGISFEYTGLFPDMEELNSHLRDIRRNVLARVYPLPHITFSYRPRRIQEELFGIKAEIVCIGYGCDGNNEGLKVTINSDCTELIEAFRLIAVPHITLSLSPNGSAVNTKDLAFHPIEPFKVSGIYGGFCKDSRSLITSMPFRAVKPL